MTETVSFYSYKGGVGRSLMLASVAILLAQRGCRVACIDFDLESGGLHTTFGLKSKDIRHTVLDLVTALSPLETGQAMCDLTGHLPFNNESGRLWLLPTVTEAEKLRDVFESGRDLAMLLGHIIREITDTFYPDFILVDCRSGFAESASAPILKADRLVCVLRPSQQNIEGIKGLLDILNTLGTRPMTFLVLSQVPDTSEAAAIVDELQGELGNKRRFDVVIPYILELGFAKNVITLAAQDQHLVSYCEPIIDWLEGTIT